MKRLTICEDENLIGSMRKLRRYEDEGLKVRSVLEGRGRRRLNISG